MISFPYNRFGTKLEQLLIELLMNNVDEVMFDQNNSEKRL